MTDQNTTEARSIDGAASALDDGLEVTAVMMTNKELADAIEYAFNRCDQRYVGGYTTSNTEPGKMMLAHLKELLAIQCERAGMLMTSNA